MNPSSFEVTTAVHDWRLDEKRHNGYTEIYADRIKTDTALFYDAVRIFLSSFREFSTLHNVNPMPLRCTQTNKWQQGIQIMDNLNQVMSVVNSCVSIVRIIILKFRQLTKE